MNELALFCGAGGGLLGSVRLGHTPVCGVEIDPFCRQVVLQRQLDGYLPPFPIWDDIRSFDGRPWRGCVDLVTAGFACQPFSSAGKRKGAADDRNVWPDTARVIREVGPTHVWLENSPAIRNGFRRDGGIVPAYLGVVLRDLATLGFEWRYDCVPASAVGAPHQRDRWWCYAWQPARVPVPDSLGNDLRVIG